MNNNENDEKLCRICCEEVKQFESLCQCKGSNVYHHKCLAEWIQKKLSSSCDICTVEFKAKIVYSKPTFCQMFKDLCLKCDFKWIVIWVFIVLGMIYFIGLTVYCIFNDNKSSFIFGLATIFFISFCIFSLFIYKKQIPMRINIIPVDI